MYTELHSAQVNLYTIVKRSDLGTESLAVIKVLILKEVNASLISRSSHFKLFSEHTHLTLSKIRNVKNYLLLYTANLQYCETAISTQ